MERIDTKAEDIVVMEARLLSFGTGEHDLASEQIFSDYEQTLFTRAVSVAERYGKKISLLVVPARDVWSAIVQTALSLQSAVVVAGLSTKITAEEQAFYLGRAWEAAPEPKRQFVVQVVKPATLEISVQFSTHLVGTAVRKSVGGGLNCVAGDAGTRIQAHAGRAAWLGEANAPVCLKSKNRVRLATICRTSGSSGCPSCQVCRRGDSNLYTAAA